MKFPFVCVYPKQVELDALGRNLSHKAEKHLGLQNLQIHTAKVYSFRQALSPEQLASFAQACLSDPVTESFSINALPVELPGQYGLAVAKLPGVTDDEGLSAQTALGDYLGQKLLEEDQQVFSQDLYLWSAVLDSVTQTLLSKKLLANPLIHHLGALQRNENGQWNYQNYLPEVRLHIHNEVKRIDLSTMDDAALMKLSKEGLFALNLAEMQAIKAHYQDPEHQKQRLALGLPLDASDCELEILAQTWSEHCKHKEFNAEIEYTDEETGQKRVVNSLFKTFIKGATDKVQENLLKQGNDWLIKVFSDNAGVVRASEKWLFVWKVETHNSPSALDPYGGAITGILGNNRDPLGTGIGGGRLLFNTNVLCFGPPNYEKPLLTGQLHPRRVMEGVVHGIEDGGNKSGIPTVNGALVFDERFAGKPLVYCGTGGLLPHDFQGRPSWEKHIDLGDRIVMAGGRVGKDGIHGATFSSLEIDEQAPASAVQIGSPLTQKKLYDFMLQACIQGLIKSSTDNGAGGLSSSIGELAQISNGAKLDLALVPLKYSGLRPWEIFVSESQERMTLVVEPQHMEALQVLAQIYEVELSDLGAFDNSGFLEVCYGPETVARLSLDFLHEGVPKKHLQALRRKPQHAEPNNLPNTHEATLLRLMATWNICSKSEIIRRYDHEVKGRSLIKPLMGKSGQAPQDAALVRLDWQSYEGIAVSNGILPRYGDIDAYEMSQGAFDEAIRQIIAIGGSLPNQGFDDGIFWSVNDNFCVPDSVFDAQNNPDGQEKLAKLVDMCQGLYDMATYFDIPLTSGKDSMKNDFRADGQKISVPPTVLYSMTAKISDWRKTQTAEFKQAGDLIYQLGDTYEEFGGSEFYQLLGFVGNSVPKVRKEKAKALYQKVHQAHQANLLVSCHDLSDGGLSVALAEACFGGYQLGANLNLDALPCSEHAALYAESHSRFVVSVAPEKQAEFEALFGANAYLLGEVSAQPELRIAKGEKTLIQTPISELLEAWAGRLTF